MPIEGVTGLPVTVERDIEAGMRDGTVLRSDIYRSDSAAEHPVLLMRSPCDKRSETPTFGNDHAAWWAAQRYVMVVQDIRGRFASDGDFYPFLRQMDDGYDSVQWAAHLRGSDPQGAMIGFSFVGATQLLVAVMRPPSLRAIAPAFIASRTTTDGRTTVVPSPNIGPMCSPSTRQYAAATRRRCSGFWERSAARPIGSGRSRSPRTHRCSTAMPRDALRRFDGSGQRISPRASVSLIRVEPA